MTSSRRWRAFYWLTQQWPVLAVGLVAAQLFTTGPVYVVCFFAVVLLLAWGIGVDMAATFTARLVKEVLEENRRLREVNRRIVERARERRSGG